MSQCSPLSSLELLHPFLLFGHKPRPATCPFSTAPEGWGVFGLLVCFSLSLWLWNFPLLGSAFQRVFLAFATLSWVQVPGFLSLSHPALHCCPLRGKTERTGTACPPRIDGARPFDAMQ